MSTMTAFKNRDIEELKKLIKVYDTEKNKYAELLEYIHKAFTSTSKKIIGPKNFLDTMLDIDTYTNKTYVLTNLKNKYLYVAFMDQYEGNEKIDDFSNLEDLSKEIIPIKKIFIGIQANFKRSEKLALNKYNTALNKIDVEEKKELLLDALFFSIIGGHASLLILRDLAKLIIGEKVGKTETDINKDIENQLAQKQEKNKKLAVA